MHPTTFWIWRGFSLFPKRLDTRSRPCTEREHTPVERLPEAAEKPSGNSSSFECHKSICGLAPFQSVERTWRVTFLSNSLRDSANDPETKRHGGAAQSL